MMSKFVKLLNDREDCIWTKDWIVANVVGIEDIRFDDGMIYCTESKSGSYYQCSQQYNGEDEPEWERMKPWQVNELLNGKEEDFTQDQTILYDDYLLKEIEENNRYYVEDDLHSGFNANDNWREGWN